MSDRGARQGKRQTRDELIEQAAEVAERHHRYHCDNKDGAYRNCGSLIAEAIRRLNRGRRASQGREGE